MKKIAIFSISTIILGLMGFFLLGGFNSSVQINAAGIVSLTKRAIDDSGNTVTSVSPGDEVNWVIDINVDGGNTGDPVAIEVKDSISAGQVFNFSSLTYSSPNPSLPLSNIVPDWSSSGTSTPALSVGWTVQNPVISSPSTGIVGALGQPVSEYVFADTGGDGLYPVIVPDSTTNLRSKIYLVHHHMGPEGYNDFTAGGQEPATLACIYSDNFETCDGFPSSTGILQLSATAGSVAGNLTTPMYYKHVYDSVNRYLYIPAIRYGNTNSELFFGMACWNTVTDTACPFVDFTVTPLTNNYNNLPGGIPQYDDYRRFTGLLEYPVSGGRNVYLNVDDKLYCKFISSTGNVSNCTTNNVTISIPGYATDSNLGRRNMILDSMNGNVYMIDAGKSIQCVNILSNALCGIPNWSTIQANSTGKFVVPMLSTSGGYYGICVLPITGSPADGDSYCFNTSTGVSIPVPANYTTFVGSSRYDYSITTLILNSRVYIFANGYPDGVKKTICYDYSTGSPVACSGAGYSSGTISIPEADYGYGYDPITGCIFGSGHNRNIWRFNAVTGERNCYSTSSSTALVEPSNHYYCDGSLGGQSNWYWSATIYDAIVGSTYIAEYYDPANPSNIYASNTIVASAGTMTGANLVFPIIPNSYPSMAVRILTIEASTRTTPTYFGLVYYRDTSRGAAPNPQICYRTTIEDVCNVTNISNFATYTLRTTENLGTYDSTNSKIDEGVSNTVNIPFNVPAYCTVPLSIQKQTCKVNSSGFVDLPSCGETQDLPIGSKVGFLINVKNESDVTDLAGIDFTDTIPSHLTGLAWTCSVSNSNGTCNAASGSGNSIASTLDIDKSETATFLVIGTIDAVQNPLGFAAVTNTANISYTQPTGDDMTMSDSSTVSSYPVADLIIQKDFCTTAACTTTSSTLASINAGENIYYRVRVLNKGASIQKDVRIKDLMDTNLENITWTCLVTTPGTPSGYSQCLSASGTGSIYQNSMNINPVPITTPVANLGVNGEITVIFSARVKSTAICGILPNTAIVEPNSATRLQCSPTSTDDGLNCTGNDTSSANTIITRRSNLQYAVSNLTNTTTNSTTLVAGQDYSFDVTITNVPASGVVNNDLLLSQVNLTFVDPADMVDAYWTCTASSGNTCQPTAGGTSNMTADIAIKSGTAATSWVKFTIRGKFNTKASGVLDWNMSVAPNGCENLGSAANFDPYTGGNEPPITNVSDLEITKKTIGSYVVGQNGAFEMIIKNLGPSYSQYIANVNPRIEDTLPDGMTCVDPVTMLPVYTLNASCKSNTGWSCRLTNTSATAKIVSCYSSTGLELNESKSLLLDVFVGERSNPSDTSNLINHSRVFGRNDPNPANDTSDVTISIEKKSDLKMIKLHDQLDRYDPIEVWDPISGQFVMTTPSQNYVPGATVTYRLIVENQGPSPSSTPFNIRDTLPLGMSFVSITGVCTPYQDNLVNGQGVLCSDQDLQYMSCSKQTLLSGREEVTCNYSKPGFNLMSPTTSNVPGDHRLMFKMTVKLASDFKLTDSTINTACVTGITPEPNTNNSNNCVDHKATVTPVANVNINKTTNQSIVWAGDKIVYDIKIINYGPSDAVNFVMEDPLPLGAQNVTTEIDSTGQGASNPLTCQVLPSTGSLSYPAPSTYPANGYLVKCTSPRAKPGAFWNVKITMNAPDEALVDGSLIHNVASIKSDTPNGQNNNESPIYSAANTTVYPKVDLTVEKSVSGLKVGSEATYIIEVKNLGPSTAVQEIYMVDELPAGIRYKSIVAPVGWNCEYTDPKVTCVKNTPMSKGDNATFMLTVDVLPISGGTVIQNSVTVSSNTDEVDYQNNLFNLETSVVSVADLDIEKSLLTPEISCIGEQQVYTLRVTNNGLNSSNNIVIEDLLPAAVKYVSSYATMGSYNNTSGLWNIDALVPGQVATLNIVTKVMYAGSTTNIASIKSTGVEDPFSDNNQSSAVYSTVFASPIVPTNTNTTNNNTNNTTSTTNNASNNGNCNNICILPNTAAGQMNLSILIVLIAGSVFLYKKYWHRKPEKLATIDKNFDSKFD